MLGATESENEGKCKKANRNRFRIYSISVSYPDNC